MIIFMFILFSQAISIDVSQYSQTQWFVLQLSSYSLFISYTVVHVYVIFSAGSLGHGDSLHFLSCPYPLVTLVVTLEWDPSPRHAAESSKLPLCDSRSTFVWDRDQAETRFDLVRWWNSCGSCGSCGCALVWFRSAGCGCILLYCILLPSLCASSGSKHWRYLELSGDHWAGNFNPCTVEHTKNLAPNYSHVCACW